MILGSTISPRLIRGQLREYQDVALDWLVAMNKKHLPTILADEPGLGRRVTTAALLAHLASDLGDWGPHLLVAPLSACDRWQTALRSWCPALAVTVYSGNGRDRRRLRHDFANALASGHPLPNVILTSYRALFLDQDWFVGVVRWRHLVLAEVQNVAAVGTPEHIRALCQLRSCGRLLIMSGPLKENPIDLWQLLYILLPRSYNLHHGVGQTVVEGTVEYNETVRKLQKVLAPFILSRGRARTPGLDKQLPVVKEVPIHVSLTRRQRKMYDDYIQQPDNQVEGIINKQTWCISYGYFYTGVVTTRRRHLRVRHDQLSLLHLQPP